jgi:tol-pal system protein YbgF
LGQNGFHRFRMIAARSFFSIALAAALLAALPAQAQFPFGNRQQQQYPPQDQNDGELAIRVDRLEQALRQLTGQIEQLQMQNQQLMQQLQRGENAPMQQQRPVMQQQRPQNMPPQQQQNVAPPPLQQQAVPPLGPPQQQQQNPQRRGDAFDPENDPNAPGRPRNLGQIQPQQQNQPQGPMVLTPNSPQNQNFNQNLPPPDQNPGPGPQQQAVLPPSNSPKDAYDLAYGYVLRRDYALAEQSFRAFIDQHQGDRNVPLASYWLGESLYQQKKYNDAANVFLDIYKQHPQSQRAPDSLLRLGQSLAQLGNKEGACGSLGAVLSRYPKASANVKKNAEDEQKRLGC